MKLTERERDCQKLKGDTGCMKQAKQKTTLMELFDISNISKIKDSFTGLKTYSNRLIKMKMNLQGKDSVTVIIAYAPISSAEDENAEKL